jgi:hypothetical protein
MSTVLDTLDAKLDTREDLDRVYYETGTALDKLAFRADQDYHRGRLARALAFLSGAGTLSGLKVSWDQPTDELMVSSGVGVDRVGRLVEIRQAACIRLPRWVEGWKTSELRFYTAQETTTIFGQNSTIGGIIADVYLRFAVCPRGFEPAFAIGPFDGLDAVAWARLRDAYELKLIARAEDTPPLPQNRWLSLKGAPDNQRQQLLHDAIVNGHKPIDPTLPNPALTGDTNPSSKFYFDPNAIFLARVLVPATQNNNADLPPGRTTDAPLIADAARPFVYTTNALAMLLWGI